MEMGLVGRSQRGGNKMDKDEKEIARWIGLAAVILLAPMLAKGILSLFYGAFGVDTIMLMEFAAGIRLLAAICLSYRLLLRVMTQGKA